MTVTNEKIQADIDKVSANRNNPETQAYIQKTYGGTVDDYIASQTARMTQPTTPASTPPVVDSGKSAGFAEMENFLKDFTGGFLKTQQASLESNLNAQIAELESAFAQAISEGSISLRDAQAQFEAQKKTIQQQAYQDADRTALYGQEMGIQNSQQQVGLMQGDAARKNNLINENMTTRDKRVNDIKDRLSAIKSQKDTSVARAKADFNTGMLNAQGQAQQMFGQGMFDLKRDDYAATRDQGFAQENLRLQDELQGKRDERVHEFNLERDVKQTHLRLKEMNFQQGLNKEMMGLEFDNMMKQLATKHGYDLEVVGAQSSARMNEIKAGFNNQMELLKRQSDMAKEELKNTWLNPNSVEYKARQAQNEEALKWAAEEAFATFGTQMQMEMIASNPFLPEYGSYASESPRDWTKDTLWNINPDSSLYNVVGTVLNKITGYDKNLTKHQTEQRAIRDMLNLVNTGSGYSGFSLDSWTQSKPDSFWEALARKLVDVRKDAEMPAFSDMNVGRTSGSGAR